VKGIRNAKIQVSQCIGYVKKFSPERSPEGSKVSSSSCNRKAEGSKITETITVKEFLRNSGSQVLFLRSSFTPLGVIAIKIFISSAKYYYNTTYLFTLKALHNPIMFQILTNHVNAIIIIMIVLM